MGNYWPVVMWLAHKKGNKGFEYEPSWAHHNKGPTLSYDTYEGALLHAYRMALGDQLQRTLGDQLQSPSDPLYRAFIPKVIFSKGTPRIIRKPNRIKAFVSRIPLWRDQEGATVTQPSNSTQET